MIYDESPFGPGPKKARIEIIPLIDVIFFLLATFVLFTLSLNKIRDLETQLPKTDPTRSQTLDDTNTVYLQTSDGGQYYWRVGHDGTAEIITASEIRPRLEDFQRRIPTARVFVRGDGKARFGAAIRALDEVRKAGIKQVSVETIVSSTGS